MNAARVTAEAARRLLRGRSWEALAREIAWSAERAAGVTGNDVDWLTPLVEGQLAARLDALRPAIRRAGADAEAGHLAARPHDPEGARVAAEVRAHDTAVALLSALYLDVLDWAVGLLRERHARPRRRWQRLLRRRARAEAPVECDVPGTVADGLTWELESPGWPDRDAA